MKTLVRQIQEAINQAEQNIRVVEIVPVSSERNDARSLEMSEHKAARTSEAIEEMRAS
jgi:hypothetical protein